MLRFGPAGDFSPRVPVFLMVAEGCPHRIAAAFATIH
jgi:hypothetical protein